MDISSVRFSRKNGSSWQAVRPETGIEIIMIAQDFLQHRLLLVTFLSKLHEDILHNTGTGIQNNILYLKVGTKLWPAVYPVSVPTNSGDY